MTDQADRIDTCNVTHIDVFEIARIQVKVLVYRLGDDEYVGEFQCFELFEEGFGFLGINGKIFSGD